MQQIPFIHKFRELATRLKTFALAGEWARLAARIEADGGHLTPRDGRRLGVSGIPARRGRTPDRTGCHTRAGG